MVQGAGPARPAPLVGVVWIAQEVVIAVGLFRQLSHIAIVAVDRTEAPGSVSREVQLAISRCDQLRQRFPDPAGAAEAVQRQSGRHEQPTDAWYRPQQGVRVGCHRVRMADELHDAGLSDERKPSRRPCQQGLEPALVRRDGGAGMRPGNAVDPSGVGVQLVAAQYHAAGLGLPVDEVVRVAETGHVVRELGALDRLQRGVLVIDRRGHHERSGHGRHLGSPDAAGDHHHLSLDPAGLRLYRLHGAPAGELQPGHPRSG